MYLPVRIDALLGEQSEVVTNALGKYTPPAAIASRLGVSTNG
jgi:hypothetical protein